MFAYIVKCQFSGSCTCLICFRSMTETNKCRIFQCWAPDGSSCLCKINFQRKSMNVWCKHWWQELVILNCENWCTNFQCRDFASWGAAHFGRQPSHGINFRKCWACLWAKFCPIDESQLKELLRQEGYLWNMLDL